MFLKDLNNFNVATANTLTTATFKEILILSLEAQRLTLKNVLFFQMH